MTDYQNLISKSWHRVLAIITVQLPYQTEIINIFWYLNFFEKLTQWALLPLGADTNFSLQYFYRNDINPKSCFGKI